MALAIAIGDNPLADSHAKEALEILTFTYPNHGWHVECKQGIMVIKHLEASGMRGLIGMCIQMKALSHDAERRKHNIKIKAGELLERAGLARGARNADPVRSFDFDDDSIRKYWHAPRQQRIIH